MTSSITTPFPQRTLLSLAIATALCGSASAQTQLAATTLNPVLVTAQADEGTAEQGYRVENTHGVGLWGERSLQDTPYSMTVISESLIENSAAKDMNQIFKMVPTAQEEFNIASDGTGNYRAMLRGFSVANPVSNGIASAGRVAGTPSIYDVERVEIINGATGFLYGGGRVGGAVNYVTKKSTLEDLRVVTVGSNGGHAYFSHIDLGGQFNADKTFGYRLNAAYQNGETTRKEDRKQKTLSLSLDWRPNSDFSTELRYSYKDSVIPGPNIFWGDDFFGIDKNQSFTPPWLLQTFTSHKFENNTRWKINPIFTLRTTVSLENIDKTGGDARMTWDGSVVRGSPNRSISWFGSDSRSKYKKTGAALYLDSTFDTFGISHTLTTGYSFAADETKSNVIRSTNTRIPRDISLEEYRNWPKPATWNANLKTGPMYISSRPKFTNILIGDDILFNDQWSLMVGFNYATAIERGYERDGSPSPYYNKSVWTPTVSLSFKPIEALTTYATYIESLENGTVVSNKYLNEGEVIPPYVSKQYELGAKYTFDQRLSVNAALFRLERANSDTIRTSPKPTYARDGLRVHQGLELSVMGKLTENLSVMLGGTLMDLKVKKTRNADTLGKSPTGVAKRLAKMYLDYRVPGVPGLYLSGGAYYTGKKFDDAANTKIIPSYTAYDVGARYETKLGGTETTFNLSIQNLTDKVYWASTMGDPRTIAFTVKAQF